MNLSISEIIQATGGVLVHGNRGAVVERISTDTRTLSAGDFYVALIGPRFDGHHFADEAVAKGASGVLVSRDWAGKNLPPSFLMIRVKDTLKALGDLAHHWRMKFPLPVVAITGSCGKTATKDLIADCLDQEGPVCKTEGNLNNLIGLPLTLFRLTASHGFAVLEMGMNAFGEIARLTEIARPTVGLITNVGLAHLEGVKNLQGVAKAKSELFAGLFEKDTAVVNADDPFIEGMPTRARKILFGFSKKATVHCEKVTYRETGMEAVCRTPEGKWTFELPFVGDHYVMNWLATLAVASVLGLSAEKAAAALRLLKPSKMRGEEMVLENDVLLVDDSYNANPTSMAAAFKTFGLKFLKRRRVAVLGEMLELGADSPKLHEEVGREAFRQGIKQLIAFGDHSADMVKGYKKEGGKEAASFTEKKGLGDFLVREIRGRDAVLVKGSRGSRMEEVVLLLKKTFGCGV